MMPVGATVGLHEESLTETYEEKPPSEYGPERSKLTRGLLYGGGGYFAGFLALWLARHWKKAAMGMMVCLGMQGFTGNARACINVEENTLDSTYADYTDNGWFTGTVRNALKAKASDDPHLKPNPKAYSTPPAPGVLECDNAARKIIAGDAAGALEILKRVESEHPGLYMAAANMGTAYELTGDDESALKWINEGIRRNPDSHMLAEWLHVKILEAKIALKKDPAWLETHTITGLDAGRPIQNYVTLQGEKSGYQVLESIRSQATVRALFIKPQDVIMARLLREAASFALRAHPASVPGALDLAVAYGLPESETKELREAYEEKRMTALLGVAKPGQLWFYEHWHWLLFGFCAALGALTVWLKWMRERQETGGA
jgi:hypothetical protein